MGDYTLFGNSLNRVKKGKQRIQTINYFSFDNIPKTEPTKLV
jgi:hypothetical protein